MAKWRQDRNTGKLVPIDEASRALSKFAIHGDIQPFVSIVDGTVISDRKQLREHNKRNNVVNASEFSQEWIDKKRKERDRIYTGEKTSAESLKCKQQIYETWMRAERNAGY